MPHVAAIRHDEIKQPEKHGAAQYHRPHPDEEIAQHLPGVLGVPGVINVSQRATVRVRLENLHVLDAMEKYQAKKGVPQLVNRRAQPGHQVGALRPHGVAQRFECELGNELYQQPEDKNPQEKRGRLAQRGQKEIFYENQEGHAA